MGQRKVKLRQRAAEPALGQRQAAGAQRGLLPMPLPPAQWGTFALGMAARSPAQHPQTAPPLGSLWSPPACGMQPSWQARVRLLW